MQPARDASHLPSTREKHATSLEQYPQHGITVDSDPCKNGR
jgi:hypothetical protein